MYPQPQQIFLYQAPLPQDFKNKIDRGYETNNHKPLLLSSQKVSLSTLAAPVSLHTPTHTDIL